MDTLSASIRSGLDLSGNGIDLLGFPPYRRNYNIRHGSRSAEARNSMSPHRLTSGFSAKAFPDSLDISLEVKSITVRFCRRIELCNRKPPIRGRPCSANESAISGSWHGRCLRKMSHFSWFFKGTEELVPSRGSFAGH